MTCRFRQSNFRKSSLDDFGCATPVLSPGIARAAVWVGLGAVAWSRGIGWRSGVAAVLGVKTGMFKDPFGHHYYHYHYRAAVYNKRVSLHPSLCESST